MKVHVVIDLVYGEEGSPGIKVFRSEASAVAEEKRLLELASKFNNDDGSPDYIVVRDTAELED